MSVVWATTFARGALQLQTCAAAKTVPHISDESLFPLPNKLLWWIFTTTAL